MAHEGTPHWEHDCSRCKFLGRTIGGGKPVDLYVHEKDYNTSPTLIARFGNEGGDYYSTDANYAHATGHSELFAASYLWQQLERDRED